MKALRPLLYLALLACFLCLPSCSDEKARKDQADMEKKVKSLEDHFDKLLANINAERGRNEMLEQQLKQAKAQLEQTQERLQMLQEEKEITHPAANRQGAIQPGTVHLVGNTLSSIVYKGELYSNVKIHAVQNGQVKVTHPLGVGWWKIEYFPADLQAQLMRENLDSNNLPPPTGKEGASISNEMPVDSVTGKVVTSVPRTEILTDPQPPSQAPTPVPTAPPAPRRETIPAQPNRFEAPPPPPVAPPTDVVGGGAEFPEAPKKGKKAKSSTTSSGKSKATGGKPGLIMEAPPPAPGKKDSNPVNHSDLLLPPPQQ